MKLALSTIFLVILCGIPGLFAQRGRNLVRPRSFEDQGASTELGELVALGVSTHGSIFLFLSVLLFIAGCVHHWRPLLYFQKLDAWQIKDWGTKHPAESLAIASVYIFLTFAASHWLGVFYGVWKPRATAFGISRIP